MQSRQKCVSPSRYHDKYYSLDVSYIFAFCVLLDLYIFPLWKWRWAKNKDKIANEKYANECMKIYLTQEEENP